MIRFISLGAVVGLAALLSASCGGDDTTFVSALALTPAGGASAGRASGGSGGNGNGNSGPGASAAAGSGPAAAGGGSPALVDAGVAADVDAGLGVVDAGLGLADAGDGGAPIPCALAADCDDQNACTIEQCSGGFCNYLPVAIGTACGDAATDDECTQPDTCDAAGVCLANNQPDGTLCSDGHCSASGVCDCAVERITAVPYSEQWQTTADTEVDAIDLSPCQLCDNTRDHIVVFTAPTTATYRFTAASLRDVELGVFEGDCGAPPQNLECGEDIDPDNDDLRDRLDLALAAGTTVSVVVGEQCEGNGGEGNLRIELSPDQP